MGSSGSGALSGGVNGAAAGSMFGPWGAAIGGGVGAIGGLFGGKGQDSASAAAQAQARAQAEAANAMYQMQADMAIQNQKFASAQYFREYENSQIEQGLKTWEIARVIGSQRATMGSGNFNVNAGSNAELQTESVRQGAIDINQIARNHAQQARVYEQAAINYLNQATSYRAQGMNALSLGNAQANAIAGSSGFDWGSVLGSFGNAALVGYGNKRTYGSYFGSASGYNANGVYYG